MEERTTHRRLERARTFTVADDGQGFDASQTSYCTGLQSMPDRLAAIDGTLVIMSSPGQDTTISGAVRA